MSEEEKEVIDKLWRFDCCYNKEIKILLNLIEKQQKELNSLKEIEQLHQEENRKLRVELEQEKERNNELEIELSIRDNINVDKLVEKYRYYRRLVDSYQANCISKEKIRAKIEELKKEQKEYKKSQEWEIQDDIVAQISILEELLEEK